MITDRGRRLAWQVAAGAVMAGATVVAMWRVTVATAIRGTAVDFASTTWHAVRGLLAGDDVYAAGARIAGIGQVGPAGEHLPASLLWQAPFAALPLWPAFLAFALASIIAVWAAVLILASPRTPQAVLLAVSCGAFAILSGGGVGLLALGQPTAFALLGIAIVVRARRPWVAGLGFMLAASTIQTGAPLAVVLTVLGGWPVVWRGAVLVGAMSLPALTLGVAAAGGVLPYLRAFAAGAFGHLGPLPGEPRWLAAQPYRIDLGALLHRAGVASTAVQVTAGLLVLALALPFLARLPARLRRIDYPPVLCLTIAVILLCAYHQPYDMVLVAGAVMPVLLLSPDRSALKLAVFALAGVSAGVAGNAPVAVIVDPLCLLATATLSAGLALRDDRADRPGIPEPAAAAAAPAAGLTG